MAEQNPISPQTSYPVMPDTSLDAYYKAMNYPSGGVYRNGFLRYMRSTFGPDESYNQWRERLLNNYNSDINAYNAYITSLAGQRAMAEASGYNPAWLDTASGGSASPLDYQNVPDPAEQIPDSIGSFLSSIRNAMGIASGAQEITSKSLQNDILRATSRIKNAEADVAEEYFRNRKDRLGFLSDWQSLLNDSELAERYSDLGDTVISYNGHDYVINRDTSNGFISQKQRAEIDYRKEAKELAAAQRALSGLSAKEKQYYIDHIQPLIKDYTEGKKTYQDTVNAYYEEMKKNEMNNRTANTVSRIFFGLLGIASRVFLGTDITTFIPETGEVVSESSSRPTLQVPK